MCLCIFGKDIDEDALQQLARFTGGHSLVGDNSADATELVRKISNQLKGQFEISYPTQVDGGLGDPSSYTLRFRPVTTLAWTNIEDGECGAPVAGTVIGEIAACTVENLQTGTVYFFQVRSFRGALGVDAAMIISPISF